MQKYFDIAGISLSGICAIHCIFTPMLIMLSPIISMGFWSSHVFHADMIYLIIPTAVLALAVGCTRHRDVWVAVIGINGICILGIAFWSHTFLSENLSIFITLIGSLIIILAHCRNRILCRRESFSCHDNDSQQD